MLSSSSSSPANTLLLLLTVSSCNFSHAFNNAAWTHLQTEVYHQKPPMTPRFWIQQVKHGQHQQQQFFTTTTTTTRTRLYDKNASFGPWRDSLDDNNHPDDFDVEAVRERLESLVLDGRAAGAAAGGGSEKTSSSGDQEIIVADSTLLLPPGVLSSPPAALPLASRFSQTSSSSSSSQSTYSLDQQQQQQQHGVDNNSGVVETSNSIFSFALPQRRTVLTSIERERREAEIQLLSRLTHGDDVLVEIWALWFQERGPTAAARLVQAEELMTMSSSPSSTSTASSSSSSSSNNNNNNNNPEQQVRFRLAEQVLLNLIREYGLDWSEPINRLATLYYMQGRFVQAIHLCQLVLQNKPWHFGTLSGIVMVYASLQDSVSARHWASHRLPTYNSASSSSSSSSAAAAKSSSNNNRRRQFWVETAVAQAQQSLLDAERRAHSALGALDSHHYQAVAATANQQQQGRRKRNNDDDDDAWQ